MLGNNWLQKHLHSGGKIQITKTEICSVRIANTWSVRCAVKHHCCSNDCQRWHEFLRLCSASSLWTSRSHCSLTPRCWAGSRTAMRGPGIVVPLVHIPWRRWWYRPFGFTGFNGTVMLPFSSGCIGSAFGIPVVVVSASTGRLPFRIPLIWPLTRPATSLLSLALVDFFMLGFLNVIPFVPPILVWCMELVLVVCLWLFPVVPKEHVVALLDADDCTIGWRDPITACGRHTQFREPCCEQRPRCDPFFGILTGPSIVGAFFHVLHDECREIWFPRHNDAPWGCLDDIVLLEDFATFVVQQMGQVVRIFVCMPFGFAESCHLSVKHSDGMLENALIPFERGWWL